MPENRPSTGRLPRISNARDTRDPPRPRTATKKAAPSTATAITAIAARFPINDSSGEMRVRAVGVREWAVAVMNPLGAVVLAAAISWERVDGITVLEDSVVGIEMIHRLLIRI